MTRKYRHAKRPKRPAPTSISLTLTKQEALKLMGVLGAAYGSGLMRGPDPDLFELLYRRWPDLRPEESS